MKEWLKLKWRTKRAYIELAFTTLVVGTIGFFANRESLRPEDIGIALGTVIALVVWLGPIIFVDIKKIKIRYPKDTFVEPIQIVIGLYYILGMVVTAIGGLLVLTLLQLSGVEILMNTEGLVGSTIMMFLILSVLLAPITAYMLNAQLRYKRIVQYKTPEWKSLRK